MVKIKTEKRLSLPQLIEWAWKNDIKHRVFVSNPNFDGEFKLIWTHEKGLVE